MLDALKSLPEDPVELRAVGELLMAEVQSQAYQIEKLKAELHGHRKARFGSKSESMDQLALDLSDDEEIEAAATEQKNEASSNYVDATEADKPTKRKHSRKPLPDHLDRQNEILSPSEEGGDCGGSLRQIIEDVTEELEYVPGRFVVLAGSSARAWPAPAASLLHKPRCPHAPLSVVAPARVFWPMC